MGYLPAVNTTNGTITVQIKTDGLNSVSSPVAEWSTPPPPPVIVEPPPVFNNNTTVNVTTTVTNVTTTVVTPSDTVVLQTNEPTVITLHGDDFGANSSALRNITFGPVTGKEYTCTNITYVNSTTVTCTVPPLVELYGNDTLTRTVVNTTSFTVFANESNAQVAVTHATEGNATTTVSIDWTLDNATQTAIQEFIVQLQNGSELVYPILLPVESWNASFTVSDPNTGETTVISCDTISVTSATTASCATVITSPSSELQNTLDQIAGPVTGSTPPVLIGLDQTKSTVEEVPPPSFVYNVESEQTQ